MALYRKELPPESYIRKEETLAYTDPSRHDEVGLKAGWYECIENWDEYCAVKIKGQPTHWMYEPQFPQSPSSTAAASEGEQS